MKSVLITASSFGHIQAFHLPYIKELHDLGWQVHVACGGKEAEIPYADRAATIPLKKKMSAISNFRAASILRHDIQHYKYDIIITHTSLAAFFTRLAVKLMRDRSKLITVVHGYLFDDNTPPLKALVLKLAELFTAPQTDLLLTMNAYDLQWATKHRAGKRVDFIPGMGYDTDRIARAADERAKLRQGFGFQADDFVLVYPAEFSWRKNQNFLIRALTELPANVKLLLPGSGDKLTNSKALAEELGVSGRICFPGYLPNIADCLCAADAAVSSARSEGLPFNILEAMYTGLPVAASRIKGHTDLIEDGKNGFLFDSGDTKGFADTIITLMTDKALRARLSAAGKEKAEQYTLARVMPTVTEKYLSVMKQNIK